MCLSGTPKTAIPSIHIWGEARRKDSGKPPSGRPGNAGFPGGRGKALGRKG